MTEIFAILLAGGRASRMGMDIPKQILPLGGKPVYAHSLEKFKPICKSVLIVGSEHIECANAPSGQTRQESVYNGLKELERNHSPTPNDIILIHDSARPFFEIETANALINTLKEGARNVTLAAPIKDSLVGKHGDRINRDNYYALQTPQGFHYNDLMDAHERARDEKAEFTDDTALVERFTGQKPCFVESGSHNFKITTSEDYKMAQALMGKAHRTGLGYDVHAFSDEKGVQHIRLGGINIPYNRSLSGHSDADVVLHAITDALLGSLSLSDIGDHFPPTDQSFKNMDSAIFLKKACKLLKEHYAIIQNIDVTIICEKPKIGSYKSDICARIAEICDIKASQVSVKATTTERLGFAGREEGIAAQAIATIEV